MKRLFGILIPLVIPVAIATADVTVDYTVDAGGTNSDPLNGLAARGTFAIVGDELDILLENTSTNVPTGFDVANSLLVSVGFNLPDGGLIDSALAAVIGPSSTGLSQWSGRVAGDSVAEEWIFTNGGGGDLLAPFAQVISTSSGNSPPRVRFDGGSGNVGGPFGGIAAAPPLRAVPGSAEAVSNSIQFRVRLNGTLTEAQLETLANNSIVEFGSDARYLITPEPASILLLVAAGLVLRRR